MRPRAGRPELAPGLSDVEKRIFNEGERLIPGITHDLAEAVRHRSSYEFFGRVIRADLAAGEAPGGGGAIGIIDLGCGVGHGSRVLADIPGARVTGVDLSPDCIRYARERYGAENIEYGEADLREFIPRMPPYDYVVSRGVLEHIERGLLLGMRARWRRRLLFDVPYDEPVGPNPHHVLGRIREESFSGFPGVELFYQDLEGVVYDARHRPERPNMIICVATRPGLPRIAELGIPFPVPAWRPEEERREPLWFERDELIPAARERLEAVDVVLDIGCGIGPQDLVKPAVHICCEPFGEYVSRLQEKVERALDRDYVVVQADWAEAVRLFPPRSVDTVFLVDVIEHLAKEEARRLLEATVGIARRQVAVFTPLGFMEQRHPGGRDAWGLSGGAWQEHRSGWEPGDFGGGWEFFACRSFHLTDNLGMPLDPPRGAFWAIRTAPSEKGERETTRALRERLRAIRAAALPIGKVDLLDRVRPLVDTAARAGDRLLLERSGDLVRLAEEIRTDFILAFFLKAMRAVSKAKSSRPCRFLLRLVRGKEA